ncbi:substrate-binding and VWA domain-containing protein [Actinokineospora auranticolor]|uniref:Ca-activated chloride channel family protein n=1 Tax=Actinokineospora auranticolor TaxID=155976 RepID=A0A2S6GBY9_9PSEU|nr:substrate-binding and VWA domain-containing protein [Actinokineospora auranticolor]PPK61734.1 Ca-activated chloride channel family protein [Actinokineospora auranticolor]
MTSAGSSRRKVISFVVAVALAIGLIVGLRLLTSTSDETAAEPTKCAGDSVQLRVAASPEKAGLLQQLAADYSGRTVAGRCVDVLVQAKSSGAAMQALAQGWNEAVDGPRPDVWTPAASGWVTLLRQRLIKADRSGVVTDAKPESIVTAPLVIAMPRPMAEALGWPDKPLGWRDLVALAGDPAGWAKYGHPEWGAFRLGKTNPNLSTSGLNATIGAYFAATGTSSDLTENVLNQPDVQAFVRGVEQSIVHYGDTTLTFLSNLQRADDRGAALSYISAVAVEENSLVAYNQGNPTGNPATRGQHGKPKVPLAAIYPSDGTLVSDHPFTVLAWADDTRKQVAADFLAYLRGADQQKRFANEGFRSFDGKADGEVNRDNGVLPDVRLNALTPPAPPVLDKLLTSWGQLRKQANVLLVVDVSGSMSSDVPGTGKTRLDLAKQAAINSLSQFADTDKVGLWMFSTRLDGEKDYLQLVPTGPMSTNREQLRGRLEGLVPTSGTGLYDTALAAHEYLKANLDPKAINAVVVLTDGKNEDSNGIVLDDLLGRLRTEGGNDAVRLFTIAYGGDADLSVLRRIAEATDAAAYDSSKPDTIDQVFTAVISNF